MRTTAFSLLFPMFMFAGAPAAQEAALKPGEGVSVVSPDGNASLSMSGRIQIRHTYEEQAGPALNTFSVPRLPLSFKGNVYAWRWAVQLEPGTGKAADLTDAFVERALTKGIGVRMGQFKTAYDRQQLESSGRQALVDRNIASREFGKGRELGVQFRGSAAEGILQYNAGIFNGTGQGRANTGSGNLFLGRVSWNPLGDFGLSQGDIDPSPSPRVFVDAAGYHGIDGFVDTSGYGDESGLAGGTGLRHAGVYLAGELFLRRREAAGTAPAQTSNGWYAQAGYMLIPEALEIAARHAGVDPDTDEGGDLLGETTAGINVFFSGRGHGLKLSVDASWLTDESAAAEDHLRARTQFQLVF